MYINCDAACTSLKSQSFDKVFITHALHEMPKAERISVLAEAKRLTKDKGMVIALELDQPPNILLRLFIGLWLFYWLPGNFETQTRREMLKSGLDNEFMEAGLTNIKKTSRYRSVFQIVRGEK
jgi:ubiquinone/menaquinone biosynthesis C-methylase UbiE